MVLRERHVIDTFKGFSLPIILCIMHYFNQTHNTTLWVYAALHGVYGILWCIKSQLFPDKNWEKPLTVIRFVLIVSGLLAYLAAPVLIALLDSQHSPSYLFLCLVLYIFGIFFHFTSDMQKTTTLRSSPNRLIKTGLWAYSRNPNYFGELLIYASFALLANHWVPFVLLSLIILLEWLPNMIRKERSLSRYSDFAQYRDSSGILFPTAGLPMRLLKGWLAASPSTAPSSSHQKRK
jgi:protein-S-isoprenylcysteine O-methyltransferase Ste14